MPLIDTSEFVVACSDRQWYVPEPELRRLFPQLPREIRTEGAGKLPHMCFAVEQLCIQDKAKSLTLAPNNLLLLDDDPHNVCIAQLQGVTSVLMVPEEPDAYLAELGDIFLERNGAFAAAASPALIEEDSTSACL